MNTIVKLILLGLIFSVVAIQELYSQKKAYYGYDTAGNRISRTIEINNKSAPAPSETVPDVHTETLSEVVLKIYPNPTDGLLNVEIINLPKDTKANIWLYDMSGILINSYKEVSDYVQININNQPSGTYLMKIVAGEYETEWKIIKK